MKHKLFPSDALARGTMRRAVVDGVGVVVVHTPAGALRALRDICPHRQARLSRGLLQEMVTGDEIGKRALTSAMVVLRCPWHGYEFDVNTGRCLADPDRVRVRTYSVTIEDGFVTVER
jgi:nitrite reductase (NADH) small subunit